MADLIKAEEVAKMLGVSRAWVFRAATSGLIPSVRMIRVVRFHRSDIEAFIERSTTNA